MEVTTNQTHYSWVEIKVAAGNTEINTCIHDVECASFAGQLLSAVFDLHQSAKLTKEQIIEELMAYEILDEEDFSKPQ